MFWVYFFFICGRWSKFFRGSPHFIARKVSGALIYQKFIPRRTGFGGFIFTMTGSYVYRYIVDLS